MRSFWRLQFGLRTAMLAMLALGVTPWMVVRYFKWREDQVWNEFDYAKSRRDAALLQWRNANDLRQAGQASHADVVHITEQYFNMRVAAEQAERRVRAYYGEDEHALRYAFTRRSASTAKSE